MTLRIKKLDPRAKLPAYGTEYSAGADLYCILDEPTVIEPHTTKLLSTGLSLEIPEGYAGLIFARSGLASKRSLAPANKSFLFALAASSNKYMIILFLKISLNSSSVNSSSKNSL